MATKEVGHLRTKLSWEDQGASRSLDGFKQDLKGLRSEMNLAKSKGVEYANSLKGLREQSDILTRRFKTQEEQVKELRKRYDESVKVKGEDDKATKNLLKKYNDAVATMNRTETQLKKVTDRIEEQINPWKRLAKEAGDAGAKMESVGRNMSDFGKNYSMRVTAPIVAGGAAIFKASMDFESAFAGVEKTVDGTEQQIASLRQGILNMSKEIPATTTEISNVAEAAGQLGIQTEKIEEFTRTMINLGEATNMTSDQAATEFARFANIVGMSQDDFDKLGSVIVALGNNLATTEAEISSMAMRLAGAGAQVGLTESQILAFAGALSSVGIEAEAGGSAFSKVMIEMQLAAEKGGGSLESFAKVAGMSANDFKKAYEQDATKAILAFIKGLSTAEDRGLSAIGILDEMGIKEVRLRDTLLRAAGATDVFSEAINIGSKAWEENTALTEEAEKRYATTESQLRILWNRVKDVAITLGDSLAPALMDAIDAAEPLIEKIESGAQAFSDMDEEQQRTIMKLIAMAAAIGPVSIGIGGIASATGGLLKGLGSLSSLLGKAGGVGLLGRIAGLGTMGPVGLAIGGVSALAGVIYAANKAADEHLEVTLDNIKAKKEEIDSTDQMIERFEELQLKNKLSTDEVLRYMDILGQLKDAKGEETIAKLKEEQERLAEKSGMSNEELEEFLGLNDAIVQKTPQATKAISDQGNAYAENLEELKKLNEFERKRLTDDTYMELTNELEKQTRNLEKQQKLQDEIEDKENRRTKLQDQILDYNEQMRQIDLEIAGIRAELANASTIERQELENKLGLLNKEKTEIRIARDEQDRILGILEKEILKKQDSLEETNKQLELFEDLKEEYAQMLLYEQGIVVEKGKALDTIKQQQIEIDGARSNLEKLKEAGELTNFEYKEQNRQLDEQQRKIDAATQKLQEMNVIAGRPIYKDLVIQTTPDWELLNERLGAPISNKVKISFCKPPEELVV